MVVTIQLKNIVQDLISIVGGQKRSAKVAEDIESVDELLSSFSPLSMILSIAP